MGRLARWPPPFLALAIEAEWRKRAAGVVPAQPKARPEGNAMTQSRMCKRHPKLCSEGHLAALPIATGPICRQTRHRRCRRFVARLPKALPLW